MTDISVWLCRLSGNPLRFTTHTTGPGLTATTAQSPPHNCAQPSGSPRHTTGADFSQGDNVGGGKAEDKGADKGRLARGWERENEAGIGERLWGLPGKGRENSGGRQKKRKRRCPSQVLAGLLLVFFITLISNHALRTGQINPFCSLTLKGGAVPMSL